DGAVFLNGRAERGGQACHLGLIVCVLRGQERGGDRAERDELLLRLDECANGRREQLQPDEQRRIAGDDAFALRHGGEQLRRAPVDGDRAVDIDFERVPGDRRQRPAVGGEGDEVEDVLRAAVGGRGQQQEHGGRRPEAGHYRPPSTKACSRMIRSTGAPSGMVVASVPSIVSTATRGTVGPTIGARMALTAGIIFGTQTTWRRLPVGNWVFSHNSSAIVTTFAAAAPVPKTSMTMRSLTASAFLSMCSAAAESWSESVSVFA